MHLMVNARVAATPDIAACTAWLDALPPLVGMNTLMPARCVKCLDEGNEGITGILVISTSHAAFHWWSAESDESGRLSFCLYSCMAFRSKAVLMHIDSLWSPFDGRAKLIDRAWKITEEKEWTFGNSWTDTSGTSTLPL